MKPTAVKSSGECSLIASRFSSQNELVWRLRPLCERLLSHCNAILRIDGASAAAEAMVAAARKLGKLVYHDLTEIPEAR